MVIEKEKIKDEEINIENINIKEKKKFSILGISIWRLLAYFIVYSIIGYIIETVFGLVTKGVLESRKSFLYGPFCSIYGLGAVVMIIFLQYFKKSNYTLFFGGFLIGSIVEYVISFIGEFIFHVKWWDYSNEPFNINGRICVTFSFFWGILAIYLISHFNPKVDDLIEKIKERISLNLIKFAIIATIMFVFFDCIVSSFALKIFFINLIHDYELQVKDAEVYLEDYNKINDNEFIKNMTNKYFTNEKILQTFPNLKLNSEDGNIIYIKDVLSDIQPYYLKVFDKKF